VKGSKRINPADRPLLPDDDDSGVVVNFAVGPSGVGPVMGFNSDDFFPAAPAAELESSQRRSPDEEDS
jgi:hypothetical protein